MSKADVFIDTFISVYEHLSVCAGVWVYAHECIVCVWVLFTRGGYKCVLVWVFIDI